MTASAIVEAVVNRLQKANFKREPSAFRVTSYPFEFSAVLSGAAGRASDLVILIDTNDAAQVGTNGLRAKQKIEALTLALDMADWPVVVTAVFIGPTLSPVLVEEIGKSCRTLSVSDETVEQLAKAPALDDRLRVLLPLHVDIGGDLGTDPIGRVSAAVADIPGSHLAKALIEISIRGEDEVRKLLTRELDQVILPGLRT